MALILQLIIFYCFSFIKSEKENFSGKKILSKISPKNNNLIKIRNLLTDSQKLNNIIEIYNPYDIVSYISSKNNQYGDLFITTNEENGSSDKRLVFALKSDGSNYFSDNSEPYKIFDVINYTYEYGHNYYPEITPLIINKKETLITLSHQGSYESFDFDLNKWFIRLKTQIMTENSEISRNSFLHLKYYNYSNYILNTYIAKGKGRFYRQKLYFRRSNITKMVPLSVNESYIDSTIKSIFVSCFEVEDLIECLYANSNYIYIITIFDVYDLTQVYNTTLDDNKITNDYIFGKCIYIKDNIGAFFYYLSDNTSPYLLFKKLNIINSTSLNYELVNYIGTISINSNNLFPLNSYYLYSDIIKMDDNNIIYVNTGNFSENIIIITIKLLNSDQNVLINYFKLELNKYNIKIYKDFTIFKLKGFLGIGMTHFSYDLSESKTYSSYFLIGIGSSNEPTIEINDDIFNEENNYSFNIQDLLSFSIDNNIFGYTITGIRIISSLNEEKLGFYLYSTEKQKIVETNETISLSDKLTFKIINGTCVEKKNYSIIYESIIKEPNYNDLISLSDSVDYYPSSNNNLETYYHPNNLYGKKALLNININYCYKTCQTCSCYGNNINHYCLTCSSNYPYFYNGNDLTNEIQDNVNNCLVQCPDHYISDTNSKCIFYIETTIPTTIITTIIYTTIPTTIMHYIPTTIIDNNPTTIIENIPTTIIHYIPTTIIENIPTTIIDNFPATIIHNIPTIIIRNIPTTIMKNIPSTIITIESTILNVIPTAEIISTNIEQKLDKTNELDCTSNIKNKIINQICFINFQDISNNIKNISDNHIIINSTSNSSIYGFNIEGKEKDYLINNNLIYIDFENSMNDIYEIFNLDYNSKIYALIVDIPNKNNNNSINDFSFMLYLENGTELDINKLNNIKINISLPMNNLESLNYDYATYFAEQGYDIYNQNSDFYNNACSSAYYGENDITIKDRRLEIYPNNTSINKNNCSYLYADLENKRLTYECDFTENYNEEIYDFDNDVQDNNFMSYFLDLINYKIIICKNLFFNIENYKNNIGMKICVIDFCLTTTLIVLFFIFGLKKLRISFFNEIRKKQKEKYDFIQKNKKMLLANKKELNFDKNKKNKENKSNDKKKNEKEKDNKNKKSEEKGKYNKNKISKVNKKKNEKNKTKKDNKYIKDRKENKNKNKSKKKKDDTKNKKKYIKEKKSNPIKKKNNSNKLFHNSENYNSKASTNINILAQKSQINLILPTKKSKKNIRIFLNNKYKSNSIKKHKHETKINQKKSDNEKYDYNELTYKMALKIDKRNIFQLFLWKILEKLEIIDIFINKNVKSLLLSKYFFYLLIDYWLNTLLYSDEVVSHKSHNNGKLEFVVILSINLSSKVILSIIKYYFNKLIEFEEKCELIKEIGKEIALLRVLKKFFKEIIIKTILFLIIEIGFIFFTFYYFLIFCTVYNKSQISVLNNYLISIIEDVIIGLIVTFIIVVLRKISLYFKNKYLYNTSKYIDVHF